MKHLLAAALALALFPGVIALAQQHPAPLAAETSDPEMPGKEWVIEDISGAGVIDNSRATLQFLPENRLAGSASCNRIFGSYASQGSQLSIELFGSTKMACPEALMKQEHKLLQLLRGVERYRIDDSGALILEAADGQTILARRQTKSN